jgi:hypothetical protein
VPASIRARRNTVSAVREALVGSVIEPISRSGVLGSKAKRFYYFPHKSYLEFLVANYFEANVFSIDIYREFFRLLNHEILTFIEEGPAAGVEHLRQGLRHNLGVVDARIIEVCATDKRINEEISSTRKANRHHSDIYTHYFYLRANSIAPSSYLLARLSDSSTVDSVLATFTCIANELSSSGDSRLGRALVLNCITSVSVHNIRRYVERGELMEVFRVDGDSVRAAILSKCVQCVRPSRKIVIGMDELSSFLERMSRGMLSVHIVNRGRRYKKVEFPADYLSKTVGQELVPSVRRLVGEHRGSSALFPIKMVGEIALRLE